LRSTLIVSARQRKPPFWRYDAFQRSLMVSAYHLSEANVDSYVRAIARFKPEVLDTVPSIGYFFAKLLESKNISLDFKFIFTTSEMLSRERRDFLKDRFKGKGRVPLVCVNMEPIMSIPNTGLQSFYPRRRASPALSKSLVPDLTITRCLYSGIEQVILCGCLLRDARAEGALIMLKTSRAGRRTSVLSLPTVVCYRS
jgi:hypothetical protein